MIKELYRMAVFAEVVEQGSFSKAATTLGLGKSIVSAHVAALEKRIGAQLLTRSTRALSLTQEGIAFYENCRRMVAAGEDAFTTVESRRVSVSGTIRLTSSYNVGVSFLIAALARFKDAYPDVSFDLVLEDSISHVIEERFDLAVRVGRLPDTGLFATQLGNCSMLLCAAPSFVRRYGKITKPEELAKVPWVTITQLPHPEKLHLVHQKTAQRLTVGIHGAVKTHSGIAAREFVRCGTGVGLLPDYAVHGDLSKGDLIRILPAWNEANDRPISAVFPSRDRIPTRVRLLIDFLRESLSPMVAEEVDPPPA
ncbi:MAG TPA: LysR family transcriptional regulator [Burkholderiaceae bacterium]|nr:LysR family transcriptional regulator [Burkholderiaceae bacterium]